MMTKTNKTQTIKHFVRVSICLVSSIPCFSLSITDLEHIEAHSVVSLDIEHPATDLFSLELDDQILSKDHLTSQLLINDETLSTVPELKNFHLIKEYSLPIPRRLPINKYKVENKNSSAPLPVYVHNFIDYDDHSYSLDAFFAPTFEILLDFFISWQPIKTFVDQNASTPTFKILHHPSTLTLSAPSSIEAPSCFSKFRPKKSSWPSLEHSPLISDDQVFGLHKFKESIDPASEITLRSLPHVLFLNKKMTLTEISFQIRELSFNLTPTSLESIASNTKAIKTPEINYSFYPHLKTLHFHQSFSLDPLAVSNHLCSDLEDYIFSYYSLGAVDDTLFSLDCSSEELFYIAFDKSNSFHKTTISKTEQLLSDPKKFFQPPFLVHFDLLCFLGDKTKPFYHPFEQDPLHITYKSNFLPSKNQINWNHIALKEGFDTLVLIDLDLLAATSFELQSKNPCLDLLDQIPSFDKQKMERKIIPTLPFTIALFTVSAENQPSDQIVPTFHGLDPDFIRSFSLDLDFTFSVELGPCSTFEKSLQSNVYPSQQVALLDSFAVPSAASKSLKHLSPLLVDSHFHQLKTLSFQADSASYLAALDPTCENKKIALSPTRSSEYILSSLEKEFDYILTFSISSQKTLELAYYDFRESNRFKLKKTAPILSFDLGKINSIFFKIDADPIAS